MAYGDFKDFPGRRPFNKIFHDRAFNLAKNPKYNGYQKGIASMFYKFFDENFASDGSVKNENMPDQQLAEELHKPFIRKFEKRKVYSFFKDNIWGDDLASKQLISKFNKGIRFLLSVTDIFSKYAWAIPLKDKKGLTIIDGFQKIFILV